MATDMTDLRGVNILSDEAPRMRRAPREMREMDAPPHQPRPQDTHLSDEDPRSPQRTAAAAAAVGQELALGPLVDQVAYGFARVLVVAMKELETHIANENRKLGDNVGERLDSLQASFDDLAGAVSEERSANLAIMDRCAALESATASLKESDGSRQEEISVVRTEVSTTAASLSTRIDESVTALKGAEAHQQGEIANVRRLIDTETAAIRERDARQDSDLVALRSETNLFSASVKERIDALKSDLAIQQEDIAAMKSGLSGFSLRVDGVLERLDKQAEAVHSMYLTYAQRESELEQLIEGLTRLRSVPAPAAAPRL
jgi:hypothetical protein